MSFINSLEQRSLNSSYTENGMLGYSTSGDALVDFFFIAPSLRGKRTDYLCDLFARLEKDKTYSPYALKILFYLRDIREGLGERTTFRILLANLINDNESFSEKIKDKEYMYILFNAIGEYGRWDDLLLFINTDAEALLYEFIKERLFYELGPAGYLTEEQYLNLTGKPAKRNVSLFSKWLPSINTSSEATRAYANKICKGIGFTPKQYRKALSILRKELNLVEHNLVNKTYENIDYEKVPSRANLKYRAAFLRNDEERRLEFLKEVAEGKKKINSSVNFPSDIIRAYRNNRVYDYSKYDAPWGYIENLDTTLEELWGHQKQIDELENTLVVLDGSGSMEYSAGTSNVTCYDVALGLAIYCSERCKSEYKNKLITFSCHPTYIDLSGALYLKDKINKISKYSEVAITDLEKVFDLVLSSAIDNNLKQSDLPEKILIVSDMEFDEGVTNSNVIESAKLKYKSAGYKLPTLIFWNVGSRTNTVPTLEKNVILLSGYSTNLLSVLFDKDYKESLFNKIKSERYNIIPLL